jgi:ADP-L-glycero-D-manno-heptose 6-epimerase
MILVTGSEGFIGRNLVNKLFAEDNDIFEFDAKHFEPMSLFDILDFSQIKHIYHLGAISSTVEKNLNRLFEYNVQFSIELFKHAIQWHIPITYTSSASVYGNTMIDGRYEYNPLNYYATTKQIIEMWIKDHFNDFTSINVMRLYNVYGEDERKDDMTTSPIYRFTQQAKKDGYITLFNNSHKGVRDFISISDVLRAFEWAARPNVIGAKNIYEVGTGVPISFLEVGQMIAKKYDVPIKFVDMPSHMHDKYQWYTKAKLNLPFTPMSVREWLETHQ